MILGMCIGIFLAVLIAFTIAAYAFEKAINWFEKKANIDLERSIRSWE